MRKKGLLTSVLVCLTILAMMLVMVPQVGLAGAPPRAEPVYPTKPPPPEPPSEVDRAKIPTEPEVAEEVYEGDVGILQSYWFARIYNPWKSGSSAKGKARTTTNYMPLVWKYLSAEVWLWKAVGGEWVVVAYGKGTSWCPPTCEIYAYATKSNANSAYYICTSRHEGWQNNEPAFYAELESGYVWLEF